METIPAVPPAPQPRPRTGLWVIIGIAVGLLLLCLCIGAIVAAIVVFNLRSGNGSGFNGLIPYNFYFLVTFTASLF